MLQERYYAEYREAPDAGLGLTPWLFRIAFLFEGYSGSSSELEVYAKEPLKISLANTTSNIFEPIRAQKAQIALRTYSIDVAQSFYVSSDRQIQVVVKVDTTGVGNAYKTIVFTGWLLPNSLKYDYKVAPFALNITADCGLSTLQGRPLLTSDQKRIQGTPSVSEVMRTALALTGITSQMMTGVNLYEISDVGYSQVVNGLAQQGRDPLFQTQLSAEALLSDKNEPISCWDALKKCLTSLGAALTQIEGRWWVVRVPEMAGGYDVWPASSSTTIRMRGHYSDYVNSPPNGGSDLPVDLNVYASPSGALRVLKKNPTMNIPPYKEGVRIEQNFGGWRASLPDFSQYDTTTHFPLGWQGQSLVPSQVYRQGVGTEADPFRMTIVGGSDNYANNGQGALFAKITYPEGAPERTKYLKRTIKGRFRINNTRAAQLWAIIVRQENGPHIPVNSEWKALKKLKKNEAETARFYNTYTVDGVVKAKPSWADFSYELPVIDGVLELYVFLGMAERLDVVDPNQIQTVEYADIRMEVEQDGLNLNGTQQTIAKPGQLVKDPSLTISLGDIPEAAQPNQRLDTFYNRTSGKPTLIWYRADANVGGVGNGVLGGQTLLSWLTESYARQALYPAVNFEGTLMGRLGYGPLSVLSISDAPESGKGLFTRWEWSTRACQHTVTAQKLNSDAALPIQKKEWQTPDGNFDMVDGADGEPVAPPPKPTILPADELRKKLIDLGIQPSYITGITPSGFTPGTSGKFGANLYNNNQYLASILALFRKKVPFHFPP